MVRRRPARAVPADDYCAYTGSTLLSIAEGGYAAASRSSSAAFYQNLFPTPPFETTGAPGKQWVAVQVCCRGGVVAWRLNGRLVSIHLDDSYTTGAIMLGCIDTYTSIADPVEDNFIVFDNVRVETNDCNENGVADADEIATGNSKDCNATGVPDECETITDGDYDVDGDVDADDLAAFGTAMNGPDRPPSPPDMECVGAVTAAFEFTPDAALDLADYAGLQFAATTGVFAPRATGAPTGSQFIAEVAGLSLTERENRIQQEVLGGNVPGFLREFVPVGVSANIGGSPTPATFYVTADYVCIGHDDDFVRVPMTPLVAQPIADALGCLLPTRKMVDDIWSAAALKLTPAPISPSTVDITLATTHYRHQRDDRAAACRPATRPAHRRHQEGRGHHATAGIQPRPGWRSTVGTGKAGDPIQPLYLGHVDWYVDYSHGIRLVHEHMLVDGVAMSVADVLADPELHVLLSDEGVVTNPRY